MHKERTTLHTWTTDSGLPAAIIFNTSNDNKIMKELGIETEWHCGYVGVSKGHPLFERDYRDEDIDISVHGGLTFSNFLSNIDQKFDSEIYYFGYDCRHYKDTILICDINYCKKECENLAHQLTTLTKTIKKEKQNEKQRTK